MYTKLDAINQMLSVVNEAPVSSLISGIGEADLALQYLEAASKETQSIGWNCNRSFQLRLVPDVMGIIYISPKTLRLVVKGGVLNQNDCSIRKYDNFTAIYNRRNRTFFFPKSAFLIVDIVEQLEFDALSYELQVYIISLASQRYQMFSKNDQNLNQELLRQVQTTWAILQDSEAEMNPMNILDMCPDVFNIRQRAF